MHTYNTLGIPGYCSRSQPTLKLASAPSKLSTPSELAFSPAAQRITASTRPTLHCRVVVHGSRFCEFKSAQRGLFLGSSATYTALELSGEEHAFKGQTQLGQSLCCDSSRRDGDIPVPLPSAVAPSSTRDSCQPTNTRPASNHQSTMEALAH